MADSELRRQMRGSDAMFLYFERREMPLHIGAVCILDGHFEEEYVDLLAARLHEIPRYRQRVLFAPYNLTHPFWEFDPEFDIRKHIHRYQLEAPGNEEQLSELAGRIFTPLMERDKPLWDMTVVEGLEGGRSAVIWRVHHSLVDGVAGVDLTNILFDVSKTPRRVEAQPYHPPALPDPSQLLTEGIAGAWMAAAERMIGSQITVLKLAQSFFGSESKDGLKALMATMPELMKPTEKLPFNRPCNGVRGHCWARIPFGETRAIKTALGGTINDVVLSVVSGAVIRYVKAHNEPTAGRFVRLMVPVNLRNEDPHGRMGNEISMLPVSIPLDVEDPAERLKTIAVRTAILKGARVADIIHLIGTSMGWTPPGLQYPLAAMPFLPQPVLIVNMVCTNVPGPMMPLYANGREVLTYYPHVPTGSDVGISVAVASYNGVLFYGVTYDGGAAPDGPLFRDFLVEAHEELRTRAGVRPMPVKPRAAAPAATPPAAAAVTPQPEPAPGESKQTAGARSAPAMLEAQVGRLFGRIPSPQREDLLAAFAGGSREERVAAVAEVLRVCGQPWRDDAARWIAGLLSVERLVPDNVASWRPMVRDAMTFVAAHISDDRLAPKIVEQIELPRDTAPEVRLGVLIAKTPGLQKLGQVIARVRHLNPLLRAELQKLENGIRDIGAGEVRAIVEDRLGPALAAYRVELADELLSEASVSAILEFTWMNHALGRREAGVFKVIKPHVPSCYAEDLNLLQRLAEYLRCQNAYFVSPQVTETLDEVRQLLASEVDFRREQATLAEVRRVYVRPGVRTPKPIPELSTDEITAMSVERGSKVTEARRLHPLQRRRLASELVAFLVAHPIF
ncbi:MAG TPA: hypothetical protein DEH78_07065, partial [Solibacterales bacterium]|nr:hypothetical protein [Bryobacterales bacterium]